MQRICLVPQARHRKIWPEMPEALRGACWHNDSLFLRDDGMLVGYVETADFPKARDGMAALDVNSRGRSEMRAFFEDPEGRDADRRMAPLEQVFYLA